LGSSQFASYAAYNWVNGAQSAAFNLYKSRSGTIGTNALVSNGDSLGSIGFHGDTGAQFVTGADIISQVDGVPSGTSMPGRLLLRTTPSGSTVPTECVRITSAGGLSFNAGFGSVAPVFGCRAWVTFSAPSGVIAVDGSGGVSSVTRNSAGNHTVNLSTTMPDTNFCVNVTSGTDFTGHRVNNPSTTSTNIITRAVVTPHDTGDGRALVTIHR
jgi:hypothetical protein